MTRCRVGPLAGRRPRDETIEPLEAWRQSTHHSDFQLYDAALMNDCRGKPIHVKPCMEPALLHSSNWRQRCGSTMRRRGRDGRRELRERSCFGSTTLPPACTRSTGQLVCLNRVDPPKESGGYKEAASQQGGCNRTIASQQDSACLSGPDRSNAEFKASLSRPATVPSLSTASSRRRSSRNASVEGTDATLKDAKSLRPATASTMWSNSQGYFTSVASASTARTPGGHSWLTSSGKRPSSVPCGASRSAATATGGSSLGHSGVPLRTPDLSLAESAASCDDSRRWVLEKWRKENNCLASNVSCADSPNNSYKTRSQASQVAA